MIDKIYMLEHFIGDDVKSTLIPEYGFATNHTELFEMVRKYIKDCYAIEAVDLQFSNAYNIKWVNKDNKEDYSFVDFKIINNQYRV